LVAGRLRQRQPEPRGHTPDGVLKAHPLLQLDELEDVTALPASGAVEEALVAVHREGRRPLAMERAQPLVRGAGLAQGHVLLHHLHDVGRLPYLIDDLAWVEHATP